VLLFAVPVCGPYASMSGYKFKVKLTPGERFTTCTGIVNRLCGPRDRLTEEGEGSKASSRGFQQVITHAFARLWVYILLPNLFVPSVIVLLRIVYWSVKLPS
jgi:hypothetical protein